MSEKEYSGENIWAFDETAVWFDSVGNNTIEKIGAKEVEMFTNWACQAEYYSMTLCSKYRKEKGTIYRLKRKRYHISS